MNTAALRGQTSFAMLEAPAEWDCPTSSACRWLPTMRSSSATASRKFSSTRAARPHAAHRSDRFGDGPNKAFCGAPISNCGRRPAFMAGPLYVQNLDILGGNFDFHDNPLSPTVVDSGALFIDVDMANGTRSIPRQGAAVRHRRRFHGHLAANGVAAWGSTWCSTRPTSFSKSKARAACRSGVPGIFVDELNIDTVGGKFTLHNVPVAVLDVTNPTDPGKHHRRHHRHASVHWPKSGDRRKSIDQARRHWAESVHQRSGIADAHMDIPN